MDKHIEHIVAIVDSIGIEIRIFDDKGEAVNYAEVLGGYYIPYRDKTDIILEELEIRKREAIKNAVEQYENKKSRHIVMNWKDLE